MNGTSKLSLEKATFSKKRGRAFVDEITNIYHNEVFDALQAEKTELHPTMKHGKPRKK